MEEIQVYKCSKMLTARVASASVSAAMGMSERGSGQTEEEPYSLCFRSVSSLPVALLQFATGACGISEMLTPFQDVRKVLGSFLSPSWHTSNCSKSSQ